MDASYALVTSVILHESLELHHAAMCEVKGVKYLLHRGPMKFGSHVLTSMLKPLRWKGGFGR